ncbi:Uncharacterized protein HZ326_6484 [Fusarium oxysporum f. sp. albedinis]|nr:Uncharacterized protein HZ326_6484 [Fusarium oxysporum f. sp. albedinis]
MSMRNITRSPKSLSRQGLLNESAGRVTDQRFSLTVSAVALPTEKTCLSCLKSPVTLQMARHIYKILPGVACNCATLALLSYLCTFVDVGERQRFSVIIRRNSRELKAPEDPRPKFSFLTGKPQNSTTSPHLQTYNRPEDVSFVIRESTRKARSMVSHFASADRSGRFHN